VRRIDYAAFDVEEDRYVFLLSPPVACNLAEAKTDALGLDVVFAAPLLHPSKLHRLVTVEDGVGNLDKSPSSPGECSHEDRRRRPFRVLHINVGSEAHFGNVPGAIAPVALL